MSPPVPSPEARLKELCMDNPPLRPDEMIRRLIAGSEGAPVSEVETDRVFFGPVTVEFQTGAEGFDRGTIQRLVEYHAQKNSDPSGQLTAQDSILIFRDPSSNTIKAFALLWSRGKRVFGLE